LKFEAGAEQQNWETHEEQSDVSCPEINCDVSCSVPTPVEAVEVQLGFRGQQDESASGRLMAEVRRALQKLGAKLRNNLMEVKTYPDVAYVTFEVIGSNKVDVAFHLEEMVSACSRIHHWC
jgi:hypothetical protein